MNKGRRRFLVAATSIVGAAGTVGVIAPFIKSWKPSAKAKAAGAPVRVNLGKIASGQQVVYEWRGKPVFIVHRTESMFKSIRSQNDRLRDPTSEDSDQPDYALNELRARQDKYLVLIGVCTHLGCSPSFVPEIKSMPYDSEWQGGYFCHCHGSRFDLAGRVYKNVPAPKNLEVPPYFFESDSVLVIGEDGAKEGVAKNEE